VTARVPTQKSSTVCSLGPERGAHQGEQDPPPTIARARKA
jgi:hypothetical protein